MKPAVVVAVIGLAASLLVAGAPTAASARVTATSEVEIDYSSPLVPVVTSSHKKLALQLTGEQEPAGKSRVSVLSITVETRNHVEEHAWRFSLTPGSLAINTSKGRGKVVSGGSQLAPFGQVALTFKPIGKPSTVRCSGSRTEVTHRVIVTGSLLFGTHSTGANSWGSIRIGTAHKPHVFAGRGDIEVTSGSGSCDTPDSHDPCATGVGWLIGGSDEQLIGEGLVVHGNENGMISVNREATLTAPSNAIRIDSMAPPSPPPALSVKGGLPTLVITTDGHGASGSAVMTSPTSETAISMPCARTHDESFTEWEDASFTNGDSPLVFHEQIEGPLELADQTTGGLIEQARQTD